MMPRIDFYFIRESDMNGLLRFVCRLLEKAYEQHHQVFIRLDNQPDAVKLNDLLWTFKDISFIPHQLMGEPGFLTSPIQIGTGNQRSAHQDILINLCSDIPEFFDQFSRVIEVVLNHDGAKARYADHAAFFQSKGLSANHFDLVNKNV